MNCAALRVLSLPLLSLLWVSPLLAHGGQYRGPGSVSSPPTPSSSTNGSGGSSSQGGGNQSGGSQSGGNQSGGNQSGGSSTGSSSGRPTSASGPAAAAGPKTGTGGYVLDDDLTRWQYWWEFGKDPYLRLKDSLRGVQAGSDDAFLGGSRLLARDLLAPSDDDCQHRIVPALAAILQQNDNRDLVSGCMVALAKLGRDPDGGRLGALLAPRLCSHDQEIRETAALCLGIAGLPDPQNLQLLLDLAGDTAAGRGACARAEVDERTRAFAAYGLGLLGRRSADAAVGQRIHRALAAVLAPDQPVRRNLQVAAIEALSLLAVPPGRDGQVLRDGVLATLAGYFQRDLGPGAQLVQAHCPGAIARLCPRGSALAARFKALFAAELGGAGRPGRSNQHLAQSCALALGLLAAPVDAAGDEDAPIVELLLQTWRQHRDRQARNFAVLALGQVGGARPRALLLAELDGAGRALELPWVAMALGVLVDGRFRTAQQAGRSAETDREVGQRLARVLDEVKNPDVQAALAIALGLCRYHDGSDRLVRLLQQAEAGDELTGYLAIGLALMDARRSVGDVRAVAARFARRPELLRQAATALGRLGDRGVAEALAQMLRDSQDNLAQICAIASALGQIGDRRSIEPLLAVLQDERLPALSRAFAALALGGIGDKDPLPWNAALASGLNYRAAVETLTDGAAGVLDIL